MYVVKLNEVHKVFHFQTRISTAIPFQRFFYGRVLALSERVILLVKPTPFDYFVGLILG